MIVLRVLILELEEGIHSALYSRIQTKLIGVRSTGKISIYNNLVSIVVQTQLVKVPEVIILLYDKY